jgi:CrcB protein
MAFQRESEKQLDLAPASGPPSNPQLLSALDVHALNLLTFGALFACLVRLGLTALFNAPSNNVFPLVWVQGTGCFLFGLFVHRRRETDRFWPALHVALRVGFAGGVATFASWQLQSFLAFANYDGTDMRWINNGGLCS